MRQRENGRTGGAVAGGRRGGRDDALADARERELPETERIWSRMLDWLVEHGDVIRA